MNMLARIAQRGKTLHANNSFITNISFKNFLELPLELPRCYQIGKEQVHFINEDKITDIKNKHRCYYLENNQLNNITGLLTINCTKDNIYLIDGIHRFKAYNILYEKYNIKDFNITIESWNVDDVNDVYNNYKIIHKK